MVPWVTSPTASPYPRPGNNELLLNQAGSHRRSLLAQHQR